MREFSIEELERLGLSREEAESIFGQDKDMYVKKNECNCGADHNEPPLCLDDVKDAVIAIGGCLEKLCERDNGMKPAFMARILFTTIASVIMNETFELKNNPDKEAEHKTKALIMSHVAHGLASMAEDLTNEDSYLRKNMRKH